MKNKQPERVERILDSLKKVWTSNKDLRLGQLLVMLNRDFGLETSRLFYLEDDVLEERLNEWLEKYGRK